MVPSRGLTCAVMVITAVVVGCAPPSGPASEPASGGGVPSDARGSKRMTIALKQDVPALSDKVRMGPGSGVGIVEDMVNGGLVLLDANGALQPQLAEQVPTIENGLWKVNPEGTMDI